MDIDKHSIQALIVEQLHNDLAVCEKAVHIAVDTATHGDCLGSDKYETMGLEASYLAQGQGVRLLQIKRSLAAFEKLSLSGSGQMQYIALSSLIELEDEQGNRQWLWLASNAGGLKVRHGETSVTVITAGSPLGKVLLGRQAGDEVTLDLVGRQRCYTISAVY